MKELKSLQDNVAGLKVLTKDLLDALREIERTERTKVTYVKPGE